jgi:hypothetical protein
VLIDQSLDFESRRTDVKKKYAREFQKAGLSSLTLAKFLQLEHRLNLLVDLKIASELDVYGLECIPQPQSRAIVVKITWRSWSSKRILVVLIVVPLCIQAHILDKFIAE